MKLFPVQGYLKKLLRDRETQAKITKIIDEFEDQALNPPGGDKEIAGCYLAVVELAKQRSSFRKFIGLILEERPTLNEKHFANLFFRAIQYLKLFGSNSKNGSFRVTKKYPSVQTWSEYLKKVFTNQKSRKSLTTILLSKDTSTTKYQRYIAPYGILNFYFPQRMLCLVDFGCGGNYGLRGFELEENFEKVKDKTPNGFFGRLIEKKLNLKEGLAFDKENPDSLDTKKWRIACSFYPKEFNQVNSVLEFEERLRKSRKVAFKKIDLTRVLPSPNGNNSRDISSSPFDAVIISSILYQMNSIEQEVVIERAKKVLKRDGIIIVQDFARKNALNSKILEFDDSWFNKPFGYRTFVSRSLTEWKFLEVLQWDSGRCSEVRPGEDFSLVFHPSQN